MKRILLFVLLKIAEIGVIVFVPYYAGRIGGLFMEVKPPTVIQCWCFGCIVLITVSTLVAITCVLVSANWKWSAKILNKFRGRK